MTVQKYEFLCILGIVFAVENGSITIKMQANLIITVKYQLL